MIEENTKQFDFMEVQFDKKDCKYIQEIYRLHKDQARKIFDLACGISTDDEIMNYVEFMIKENLVFVAIDKDNGNIAGCVMYQDAGFYKDIIARVNCHLVISRAYWGKNSREVINQMFKYIETNYKPIRRFEARVPSHNFGIIKLLKDTGFKIEGTCKDALIFKNKDGVPKCYNELIYSKIKEGNIDG